MSKLDIINAEIEKRLEVNKQLKQGDLDLVKLQEQLSKLDEMNRSSEKESRVKLESIYKESRHLTGKWPKVYSFTQTEYWPFFNGATDNDCNPYFPISKVKNKTFDGIAPLYVSPTGGTGTWARDRDYLPSEQTLRSTALAAISAFPDLSGEVAQCSLPAYTTQVDCTTNGGTWGYTQTATAKLRNACTAWRNKIVNEIIVDLYNDTDSTQLNFWQDIANRLSVLISAVATDVTPPSNTSDFAPGSPADIQRDYFIANSSSINTHVSNRISYLNTESQKEEKMFFNIIKLRMNQGNGSFAKIKLIKNQQKANKALIQDNIDAIASLNLMKVKSS